ncbi:RING-H2 finger protein ATL56-like [Coffea eugenioides]|uniref:RING-H2 finger protein ATL56-like n=1 Tax=Coffea eugenioides TaxID=49369 RepID=UPI000F6059CA|nr:RING-H2 finger protein ATL56-like [Coffea eugenioides]
MSFPHSRDCSILIPIHIPGNQETTGCNLTRQLKKPAATNQRFAALVLLHILLTTTAVHRHRRRRQTRRSFSRTSSLYSMQDLYDLLPHLNYSASEQTTMDCAICLEGFKEGELSRKLPDCNHLFHLNCVDNWLTKKPNCPVCRTRVQLHSGASRSRDSDDDGKFWWPVGA